jgi:two-component system chemotaxis response regulator CheY
MLARKTEHGGCICFLDPALPGGDALDMLEAARRQGSRALITVMAAGAAMPSRARLRALGVYDALQKPVTAAAIEPVLSSLLRLARVTNALVVDQSPGVRMVIRKVLAKSMFHLSVEEAADGEAAVSHCNARNCDIVLLDCKIPRRDDFTAAQRALRSKIIMMSNEQDEDRAEKGMVLGIGAALTKPFYPADVDRALHAVFGLPLPQLATDSARITVEV